MLHQGIIAPVRVHVFFVLIVKKYLVINVIGFAKGFHVVGNLLHLFFGEKCSLDANRHRIPGAREEHVSSPEKLLGADGVDDDSRVELTRHHKGDSGRDVRFD